MRMKVYERHIKAYKSVYENVGKDIGGDIHITLARCGGGGVPGLLTDANRGGGGV